MFRILSKQEVYEIFASPFLFNYSSLEYNIEVKLS